VVDGPTSATRRSHGLAVLVAVVVALLPLVGGRRRATGCAPGRSHYNLSHLCAPERQKQVGPMQDDEMLLIYAFIRVTRSARILELGGQLGGSARNFLAATRVP
jgi:hypothetical protein